MPTFTRLAAFLLFGAAAFFFLREFQLLDGGFTIAPAETYVMVALSAVIGWSYVGKRINQSILRAFSIVLQGSALSLIMIYVTASVVIVVIDPLRGRYTNMNITMRRLSSGLQESLVLMFDADFLTLVFSSLAAIAVALALVFRFAEARRMAR